MQAIISIRLQNNKLAKATMTAVSYITSDESIFAGTHVIRGTRIPVERLILLWHKGYDAAQISEELSGLSKRIIRGAIKELALDQAVPIERIGSDEIIS